MKFHLLFFAAAAVFAQTPQPNISHARFESRAFGGSLANQIRSDSPSWIGYAIQTTAGDRENCCWNGSSQCGCNLEGGASVQVSGARQTTPVQLEGSSTVSVLFRTDSGRVEKVRVYSLSCPLDAGGLPVVWITDVPAAASLTYLSGLVKTAASDHVADGAIMAIAQHSDAQADSVLEQLAASGQPKQIREKAVFWLGAARGSRGAATLKDILAHDADPEIRDKAVFALSISKQPEALQWLMQAAKSDSSPHVRSQALFWLAQKAGKQAEATIVNAIQNDPDTGVKERAVFALSQLPKGEAIPKLIEVARNQRNPEVRKRAFFWLGQSNDSRALAFIEQVLTQ